MRILTLLLAATLSWLTLCFPARSADELPPRDTSRGDAMITAYFRAETQALADACLAGIRSADDWNAVRGELRQQLFEMLGLDPLPEKTPLQAVVTGLVEHDEFVVERLHFQSRPGLYVTGNLYRPREQTGPLPAILYVCGHGRVAKDGISFGNKTHYQHHGGWFARNGYVCLIIDTLQLGEIEGIHHGTYRYGRWWWNSRGYTPAGVEAWNCIRALDYLQTRPEVDGERIGVTGRSGGGAYSWWISALDERIKVSVPVAGITNLVNHVVDGCVEGHCDCMYMVNTWRWDYAQVAALVSPRPLLITNTDKDSIFPLDGVVDVYNRVRRLYELQGALGNVGLQISEGPHKDTQELQIAAFHWFNRFLKKDDPPIEMAAVKFFEPEQLRVFSELPADELNTRIDESFTVTATLPAPEALTLSEGAAAAYRQTLLEKCFRGWPAAASLDGPQSPPVPEFAATHDGIRIAGYRFSPQPYIELILYVLHRADTPPDQLSLTVLNVLHDAGWKDFLAAMRATPVEHFQHQWALPPSPDGWNTIAGMLKANPWGMAWICPRGVGPAAWDQSEKKQVQHQRRFNLLGQTLEGMQVWDVRAAVRALSAVDGLKDVPLWLQADGPMAGIALYAALFEPGRIARLDLYDLAPSHHTGPSFLNVLRVTDVPVTVAHVATNARVVIYDNQPERWSLPVTVVSRDAATQKQVQIRRVPGSESPAGQ